MKIELVRTEEIDGIWYKILQDKMNIKCWGESKLRTEAETLKIAEDYFNEVVAKAKIKIEVLKSVEV